MKLNAFKVCHEVADRIDGVIAPDGYMKVYESLCYMWDRVFFGTQNTENIILLIKIKIKWLSLGLTWLTKNLIDIYYVIKIE